MRILPLALMTAAAFWGVPRAAAQDLPQVAPGESVVLLLDIPTADRPPGAVRYTITALSGTRTEGQHEGSIPWHTSDPPLRLPLRLTVAPMRPPGPYVAARIALVWADGTRSSLEVPVEVRSAGLASKSAKDFLVSLAADLASGGPGTSVTFRYHVLSNEATEERIRVRLEAPPGWTLLDFDTEQQDVLIDPYQGITGEARLLIPRDVAVGERRLLRLVLSFADEPGELEARAYVTVTNQRVNGPTIFGTSTIGLAGLGGGGFDRATRMLGVTLSTKLGRSDGLVFSMDEGLRDNLSNFRYEEEHRMHVTGTLRYRLWEITGANNLVSSGHALIGPSIIGRGGRMCHTTPRWIGELLVAQPSTFDQAPSGRVIRGRFAVRTATTTAGVVFSDFEKPDGGYTTLPQVQQSVLDIDAAEQLEIERQLTASTTSNRVRGAGLDVEWRPSRQHRLTLRGGALSLANADEARASGPAGEASYSYTRPEQSLTFRWRQTPPTVSGLSIPRDELSADGSVRAFGDVSVVARAYRNAAEMVGRDFFPKAAAGSAGLRYRKEARTFEARLNYRESQVTRRNIRRTVSMLAAAPLGPLTLTGTADVGEQADRSSVSQIAFVNAELRWTRDQNSLSFSTSHSTAAGRATERADLLAAVNAAGVELAGGAWVTRGYAVGGGSGFWATVGIPVRGDRMMNVGIDYAPLTWTSKPSLRGVFTVRQRLAIPVPFVRSDHAPSRLDRGAL